MYPQVIISKLMNWGNKNTQYLKYFGILLLFIISVSCTQSTTSTKGKVIEIDPNSLEYLANTFDRVLVFFLQ